MNNHHLLLQTPGGRKLISSRSIIRIEALSNYCKLFFDNGGTLVVARTLRWFEGQLQLQPFIRTHRTHVVNRNFICRYIGGVNGKVQLLNGEQIDVAKRRKKIIIRRFGPAA